jgi:AcrR family transcriptional regulator
LKGSKKKKSKRQLILDAGAKLFSEKGYSATSMKDIASEVGVEAASLYNHIKSKQEILQELLLDIANQFLKGISEINDSNYKEDEKLKMTIGSHIRTASDNSNISALVTQDWKHLEGHALDSFVKIRKAYVSIFKQMILDAIEAGYLKPMNPDLSLNIILSSLRWMYNTEVYATVPISIVELERYTIDLLFSGIQK